MNAGSLGPGQSVTVTVVAQVDPSLAGGTLLENPVSASSDEANTDLFAATASTSFLVLNGVPVAVGETPPSGSGSTQNFTFQFSHPSGFQNLGVVAAFRGRGLGRALLLQALHGFVRAGLGRALLEVTAQNSAAIRLYRRLGFRCRKTLYKAVEVNPALQEAARYEL